jgi:magnesium transporter
MDFAKKCSKVQFYSGLSQELRQELVSTYQTSPFDIEDLFTNTQLSKIEFHHYFYIALQLPEYDFEQRMVTMKEIHSFVHEDVLIIVDKHRFKYVENFQEKWQPMYSELTPFEVFFEMMDFFITKSYQTLSHFRSDMADVERDLFDFEEMEDLLRENLIIKRNIINFLSIISPLRPLIEEMQGKYAHVVGARGVELLDDSLDKVKKMINTSHNLEKQMNLLIDTNETLISRSTNETIKFLTSFNIIMLVPTFFASFFGMNVFFGWDIANGSFVQLASIILLIIISSVIAFWFFRKKHWL